MNALRPYISRPVAVLIAFLVTWLGSKGINLDPETQSHIQGLLETAVFLIIYAVSHRTLDKKVNPGDSASSHLAVQEAAESQDLKEVEKTAERRAAQAKGEEGG